MEFVYSPDDKQLQEYYDNLRQEFERDCAQSGKKSACHQLAEFYDHIDRNPARARPLLHDLCHSRSYARSCHYLGSMFMAGRGGERNVKTALELFERACSMDSVEGCHNAGMIHRLGKAGEVPVDGAKALERFTYGCDRDYPNSCYYLSVMYLQGKPPPVDKDMLKALQYAEKACEFNHPWACVNAARMLATGDGVPKDEERAKVFAEKARQLSHAGEVEVEFGRKKKR